MELLIFITGRDGQGFDKDGYGRDGYDRDCYDKSKLNEGCLYGFCQPLEEISTCRGVQGGAGAFSKGAMRVSGPPGRGDLVARDGADYLYLQVLAGDRLEHPVAPHAAAPAPLVVPAGLVLRGIA